MALARSAVSLPDVGALGTAAVGVALAAVVPPFSRCWTFCQRAPTAKAMATMATTRMGVKRLRESELVSFELSDIFGWLRLPGGSRLVKVFECFHSRYATIAGGGDGLFIMNIVNISSDKNSGDASGGFITVFF